MISFRNVNGTWYLQSDRPLQPGTQVTVSKRDGSTKTETVGAEFITPRAWVHDTASLYHIERTAAAPVAGPEAEKVKAALAGKF